MVGYRLTALALLVGAFYMLDWMPLRTTQRDLIAWSLRMADYAPVAFTHDGSPAIRVEKRVYFYTAECTYLDLFLIVAPFLWVFGGYLRGNILRVAVAALVILGGNLIRSWASIYYNVRGTEWFYAHDLPDHMIWWATAAFVVLLAVRRDLRGRTGASPTARVLEAEMSVPVNENHVPAVED
jgi:exosortase/archaeosortase family protein